MDLKTLEILQERSESKCELCNSGDNLKAIQLKPLHSGDHNDLVLACEICHDQYTNSQEVDSNHWRCLNESMWSEVNAVKVVAYRMLRRLTAEGWPNDLLEMLTLEEDIQTWADSEWMSTTEEDIKHLDCNGTELTAGDTVTLIKDLNVKGAGFTAKRGTAVRRISLVHENSEHIEGRVNDQRIVILTKFVKKSN